MSVLAAASLAACSPEPAQAPDEAATASAAPGDSAAVTPAANGSEGEVSAPATPAATATPAKVIGLEGLGDLRIGEAVPQGSSWAERGAQVPGSCRTVTSPDYPGVYAIVEGGKVRRISVGHRSDVKLVEGIGVGSSEADVKKWFGGFRETGHKYLAPPAKYLTAPNAQRGDPALRFEIDGAGKVSHIHVGTMPVLGYVEGCA